MRSKLTAALAALTVALGTSLGAVTLLSSPAEAAGPPAEIPGVPHYFGPYPNWALSPLTTSTAVVAVNDVAGGAGTGATASAVIDPVTGGIQSVNVLTPGSGYSAGATADVTGGAGASLSVDVNPSGGVTGFVVDPATGAGTGYGGFTVTIGAPGGTGTTATAEATGGVDAVEVVTGGAGFTAPTVEFDLPSDPNGTVAKGHAILDGGVAGGPGIVTSVVVDNPGSGYTTAPTAAVHNGTLMDPIAGATPGTFTTTLKLQAVNPIDLGTGYTGAPTVTIGDPIGSGTGAFATATYATGGIVAINVVNAGTGFLSKGIKKFQDQLPVTCDPSVAPGCPSAAGSKFIPVAAPEQKPYTDANGVITTADEIVIGLVQYRTQFNTDLPPTMVRGYVQIETPAQAAFSQHFPLQNELLNGTKVDLKDAAGNQYYGVTSPQWLGPFINATKNKPVRVVFRNLLPTGKDGDLFLPVDSSMMGSGMGPDGMAAPANLGTVTDGVRNPTCTVTTPTGKPDMCFKDNRATLHLHGGMTPWISDGTPHQWITPAGDTGNYPQGVSVQNVPDMKDAAGATLCEAKNDGCQTFYYTNQQSARLMFYHDHSWGITRLNVYAGEAAGYTITDDTEKALVNSGTIPAAADTIPLVVQDRTFVPGAAQLAAQDPTWDGSRWGSQTGSLWYHHVYMPAQNPGDPGGMSAYGRWMYGPWFWPPAAGTVNGPINNPYYDPNCKLDDPATWQYQVDPFCEPQQIPGTPNISAGMEQFNDTPVVNGIAYPTVTLEPKTYRFRMLNAANDRFFNFQWYTADPTQGDGTTEVALDPAMLAAAQTDPVVSPEPAMKNNNAAGPDWVQIGNESGFLATPAVIDGQQPTTWITDPTRFDVGNVDKHSMLLAPAERSDAIVDFSKFAGKTLILYNDAPAAFPARVPSYDYYTGQPDLSPNGAPGVLAGYGPNTRTVMQVKIAGTPATAFNVTKLNTAFNHKANGTGVFESGQPPIIVGQANYNKAYGTSFAGGSNCNAPGSTVTTCDGYVRISDTATFGFNTLKAPSTKSVMPLQPKAIHDEMNSSTFDEFGRMQANLGVEAQPPTPGAQNVTLYPFTNPQTELIDGTNLQKATDTFVPISSMDDGSQIWRITHNGVDTHPIHFHLFDVQVLNRVTWDNIIIAPDPQEVGWKDTVRTSPLEDTIVALRPVVPQVPFEVPNSVRALSPMEPIGSTNGFNSIDPAGNPTAAVTNQLVNYGWEYVFHCHILSHEEMDMMRPVSLALPPIAPTGVGFTTDAVTHLNTVSWSDNSITETSFGVQRSTDAGATWTEFGTVPSPLGVANTHGTVSVVDPLLPGAGATDYRVVAYNTVGYGNGFPTMTVKSVSAPNNALLPVMPSGVSAVVTAQAGVPSPGPQVTVTWVDNATNETGYKIQRTANNGITWTDLVPVPLAADTAVYVDTTVVPGTTYGYRVAATNGSGDSAWSTPPANVVVPAKPATPTGLAGTVVAGPQVNLTWTASPILAGFANTYTVEKSTDGVTWTTLGVPGTATTAVDSPVTPGAPISYRVFATNVSGSSLVSGAVVVDVVASPQITGFAAALEAQPAPAVGPQVRLTWTLPVPATTVVLARSLAGAGAFTQLGAAPAASPYVDTTAVPGTTYDYQLTVTNAAGSATATVTGVAVPLAPTAPTAVAGVPSLNLTTLTPQVTVSWTAGAGGGAVDTFRVDRRTSTVTTWTTVGTTSGATTTLVDGTVPASTTATTYFYRVTAINVSGAATSAPSSGVVVPRTPTSPNGINRTMVAGSGVRVTWNDRANNETGFVIQRAPSATPTLWVNVGQVGALGGTGNTGTFTDTGVLPAGGSFVYRVAAINNGGATFSAASTAITVAALPASPVIVLASATRVSATSPNERITVDWSPAAAGVTGYTVRWSTSPTMATINGTANVGAATSIWTSGQLTRRVWYVQVGARNASGTTWSAITPVPSA